MQQKITVREKEREERSVKQRGGKSERVEKAFTDRKKWRALEQQMLLLSLKV